MFQQFMVRTQFIKTTTISSKKFFPCVSIQELRFGLARKELLRLQGNI